MQPTIEKSIRGNENELGTETEGFGCRHGRADAE
jgi:hypothetical protein